MQSNILSFKSHDIPKRTEEQQKLISQEHFIYNVEWAFEILRCLLQSGINGDWEKEVEQDSNQQSFTNNFDNLILLRSSEGAKPPRVRGDTIFNHYRQHAYMTLLRPSAFLKENINVNNIKETEIASQQHTDEDTRPLKQFLHTDNEYSFVMFIGWRKPDLSGSEELWNCEDGLMQDLQNDPRKNIHFYCVLPIGDGINYFNIVIGRKLQEHETPIVLMNNGLWHRRAIMSASPEAYAWVRIHGGEFQFSKAAEQQNKSPLCSGIVNIKRTLGVEFRVQLPSRLPAEIAKRFNLPAAGGPILHHRSEEDVVAEEDEDFRTALLQCPYARRGVLERVVEKKDVEYKIFA